MPEDERVAVCSRSFSRNQVLRRELLDCYPSVTFNDDGHTLSGDRLVEYLSGHEKAIVGLERIDEAILDRLPALRVISKYGVGTDKLDLEAMARRGVRLGWTGGVNSRAVAELVLAASISLLRGLPELSRGVINDEWRQPVGRQLSGRTVGIVGWGHIGRDLAGLLSAFGCQVLAFDVRDVTDECAMAGVESVDFEDLLSRSDVVSLHVPSTPSTEGMIDDRRLSLMRSDAILVNAARGGLVDEEALHRVLVDGRLGGAALDVFATEPPEGSPLLSLANVLATPHIGGSTAEAYLAMGRAAIAGLDDNEVPA